MKFANGGKASAFRLRELPSEPGLAKRMVECRNPTKGWDVNPKVPNLDRGLERIVTGSDGSAWYTTDHYHTFHRIR